MAKIRKAVIKRIANVKRCSLAVASHVYACKSIAEKQRLCEIELKLQSEAARAALAQVQP